MYKTIKTLLFAVALAQTTYLYADFVSVSYSDGAEIVSLAHTPEKLTPKNSNQMHYFLSKKTSISLLSSKKDFGFQSPETLVLSLTQNLPSSSFLNAHSFLGLDIGVSKSRKESILQTTRQDSYSEIHIAPKLVSLIMNKLDCAIIYDYTRRKYRSQPENLGTNLSDKTYSTTHSISYRAKVPVMENLNILVQGTYRKEHISISDSKNEGTNKYSQHFFTGVSWEY